MVVAQRWQWRVEGLGLGQDPNRLGEEGECSARMYACMSSPLCPPSLSPLTILTHCHPTLGMVVVGAGVRPGGWRRAASAMMACQGWSVMIASWLWCGARREGGASKGRCMWRQGS